MSHSVQLFSAMKLNLTKSSRIVVWVSLMGFFFLALIWVSYFRQKSFDRKDAIQFAIEKNSNLAVALEQYAISTLHNADAVLQLARMEYIRDGGHLNLEKLLSGTILKTDINQGVCIIDSHGKPEKADMDFPSGSMPNFSDRPYFIFHSTHDVDTLLISQPLVSRMIGKQVIVISRRFNDSHGKFGGVVALQIEPSRFTSFYAEAKLLPNDIISLVSPDGVTYARRTGNKESSGEDIHTSPLFVYVANHADSFYFAPDAIKNIPTWFSYRKLKNYPIIATVGSSESDILAGHASRQGKFITPRIIISILIMLFCVLTALILIHRQKSTDRFAEEKERYERLLTEQMIAVQEREREWIGRELHDNINQVLTTVKLYLELASKQEDNPLIPRSMQLINSSIGEIRNLSHQLSAPTLGTRSLIDSINALIEMVGFSTDLLFEFNCDGYNDRLSMSQKLALYRILQEQLNNITKHAEATRVWISLSQKQDNIILRVKDNGKGYDSKIKTSGMGLNNIISRVKVFGGSVHIESSPQKGCFLSVVIPVVSSEEEQPV
jgi:signal transduction histidine kinase